MYFSNIDHFIMKDRNELYKNKVARRFFLLSIFAVIHVRGVMVTVVGNRR